MVTTEFLRLVFTIVFLSNSIIGDFTFKRSIEYKACEIFKNEIFIKSFNDQDSQSLFTNEDNEIINSFIDRFKQGRINIYYDGKSYDVSKPYREKTSLLLAIQDSIISKSEANEIYESHLDYEKRVSILRDTIEICDFEMFIKVSNIKKALEFDSNNYSFEVNRHIETSRFSYVQINIKNYYGDGLDIYLLFNNSDGKFVRYFVNSF